MCNFASFVLTLGREFWGPTDSHEAIIAHHQIHEDGARGPNILRVEIEPTNDAATREDLSTWKYRVDQDYLPEWAELVLGIPAIVSVYATIIWTRGFGSEDRVLFRRNVGA